MPNKRYDARGNWVEVDDHERVIRIIDPAPDQRAEIEPYSSQVPEAVPVHMVAPSAQQHVEMRTSYRDRAEGFNLKTRWLAIPVAAVAALVAYSGYKVPALSVTMLTVVSMTYMVVWLAAFIWSELTSADGVSLFHTWMGWRYLRREQRERHRHYRRQERD